MAEEKKVILHGITPSSFVKRVELALKVKGIPYEYVEEDLTNKSTALLQYNPVHKKVPVLVHNGKPISESMVILEYIDETWKDVPQFLPEYPYERAKVRFWANFLCQQVFESVVSALTTDGEAQETAIKDVHEKLRVLEEGFKGYNPGGSPLFNGENMGLLDIVMCSCFGIPKAHEEVLGVNFIDPAKYPVISSWVSGLTEQPVVKETLPPHEELVAVLQHLRKMALSTA